MTHAQNNNTVEINPSGTPTATVIWLHGLGADGHDFEPIAAELGISDSLGVRFVFPHAPRMPVTLNNGMHMRAWYDVASLDFRDREDRDGITAAGHLVAALIDREIERGIASDRIVLAGFSQGGAVALFCGLQYPEKLAGILALSTYLPLAETTLEKAHAANRNTPILMIHGTDDNIIALTLGTTSRDLLQQAGYPVEWYQYPMGHEVCLEEIRAISGWLKDRLTT